MNQQELSSFYGYIFQDNWLIRIKLFDVVQKYQDNIL